MIYLINKKKLIEKNIEHYIENIVKETSYPNVCTMTNLPIKLNKNNKKTPIFYSKSINNYYENLERFYYNATWNLGFELVLIFNKNNIQAIFNWEDRIKELSKYNFVNIWLIDVDNLLNQKTLNVEIKKPKLLINKLQEF